MFLRVMWRNVMLFGVLLAIFVAILLAADLIARFFANVMGWGFIGEGLITVVLVLGLFFAPRGWFQFNIGQTVAASRLIEAPIERVWDELRPRARTDYFHPNFARIEQDRDDPKLFYYHMPDQIFEDTEERFVSLMRVTDEDPPNRLVLDHVLDRSLPGIGDGKSVITMTLSQEQGGTRVHHQEDLASSSAILLFTFLIVNPAKDTLKSLAARCEGFEDQSWAADMVPEHHENLKRKDRQWATGFAIAIAAIALTVILGGVVLGLFWAAG